MCLNRKKVLGWINKVKIVLVVFIFRGCGWNKTKGGNFESAWHLPIAEEIDFIVLECSFGEPWVNIHSAFMFVPL